MHFAEISGKSSSVATLSSLFCDDTISRLWPLAKQTLFPTKEGERSSYLSLFERFQITIDAAIRPCVALLLDLLPKKQAIVFPILPAFENRGCKWVKRTLLLASFLRFGKGSPLEPVSNCSITQPNALRNLLRRYSLPPELYYLLISRVDWQIAPWATRA